MGMFDSVYIDIECPFCGKISLLECQTKDTDCELNVWKKGDDTEYDNLEYLDCIADCHSRECKKRAFKKLGFSDGLGMVFDVYVILDKGIVTGAYKIKQTSLEDND